MCIDDAFVGHRRARLRRRHPDRRDGRARDDRRPRERGLRMAVVGSPAYFAKRAASRSIRAISTPTTASTTADGRSASIYRWEFTEDGKDFVIARDRTDALERRGHHAQRGARRARARLRHRRSASKPRVAEKRLVRVLDTYCAPFPGFFLYYPSRAHVAPKLQALIDVLKVTASGTRNKRSPAGARAPGSRSR